MCNCEEIEKRKTLFSYQIIKQIKTVHLDLRFVSSNVLCLGHRRKLKKVPDQNLLGILVIAELSVGPRQVVTQDWAEDVSWIKRETLLPTKRKSI